MKKKKKYVKKDKYPQHYIQPNDNGTQFQLRDI